MTTPAPPVVVAGTTAAALKAQGDYLTRAGWVCIAKEAARQIKEDPAYECRDAHRIRG